MTSAGADHHRGSSASSHSRRFVVELADLFRAIACAHRNFWRHTANRLHLRPSADRAPTLRRRMCLSCCQSNACCRIGCSNFVEIGTSGTTTGCSALGVGVFGVKVEDHSESYVVDPGFLAHF